MTLVLMNLSTTEDEDKMRAPDLKEVEVESSMGASLLESKGGFTIASITDSRDEVVRFHIGPLFVCLAYRERKEEGVESNNFLRYRTFIPAFQKQEKNEPGFTQWQMSEVPTLEGNLARPNHSEDRVRKYFWSQWHCTVALTCTLLCSVVSVTSNTVCEAGFKIANHHSELGVQAKQRPGVKPTVE